jgi:hypothetical protein
MRIHCHTTRWPQRACPRWRCGRRVLSESAPTPPQTWPVSPLCPWCKKRSVWSHFFFIDDQSTRDKNADDENIPTRHLYVLPNLRRGRKKIVCGRWTAAISLPADGLPIMDCASPTFTLTRQKKCPIDFVGHLGLQSYLLGLRKKISWQEFEILEF